MSPSVEYLRRQRYIRDPGPGPLFYITDSKKAVVYLIFFYFRQLIFSVYVVSYVLCRQEPFSGIWISKSSVTLFHIC